MRYLISEKFQSKILFKAPLFTWIPNWQSFEMVRPFSARNTARNNWKFYDCLTVSKNFKEIYLGNFSKNFSDSCFQQTMRQRDVKDDL